MALHNNNGQSTLGSTSSSKLKKSLSNAEDRRRKSLLPWHRKTSSNQRSKSRERNETQKSWDGVLTVPNKEENRRLLSSDIHSSHSSLTSLDLAASQVFITKIYNSYLRIKMLESLFGQGCSSSFNVLLKL